MKKVAIVSAMNDETRYIHEYLINREGWEKTEENQYANRDIGLEIYVKVLGVGKVNAAFMSSDVISDFNPDLLVNIGVSGGLSPNATRTTVAFGKSYVQTDFRPYFKDNSPVINDTPDWIVEGFEKVAKEKNYDYVTGLLATGDFFLSDEDERQSIIEKFNPVSFDMETAAIAQVATAKNTEFAAIRIFSDLANNESIDIIEKKIVGEDDIKIREKLDQRPTEILISFLEKISNK